MSLNLTSEIKTQVHARLRHALDSFTESSLEVAAVKEGNVVLTAALVLKPDLSSVVIGIREPSHRIEVLSAFAREQGPIAGFVLVLDGTTRAVCLLCDGRGCEKCKGETHATDAIVGVLRTEWGFGITTSAAYGYVDGKFERRRKLDTELVGDGSTTAVLDGYDVIFHPERKPS